MGICGRVFDVLTRVKCQIYVPLIRSRTANKCYEICYCLEMRTKDTLAWCWRSPNFMVILNPNRISSQYLFHFFCWCFESKITIKIILRKTKTLTSLHSWMQCTRKSADGQTDSICFPNACMAAAKRCYIGCMYHHYLSSRRNGHCYVCKHVEMLLNFSIVRRRNLPLCLYTFGFH